MSYRVNLMALALGLLLAVTASAQTHDMSGMSTAGKDYDGGGGPAGGGDPNPPAGCAGVQAKINIIGMSFSPAVVTITTGQPVCWTWTNAPYQHTVTADDGSFNTGAPNSSGNFQHTFTTAGTFGFYCQVHGSLTGGMRGMVIVQDATTGGGSGGGSGGSGPGTIALSPTAYTVSGSAAGAVTVTVARTGGSDGKATVKFATAPGTAKSGKDFTARTGLLSWAAGDGAPKTIEVPIKKEAASQPDKSFSVRLSKATGAALGTASAVITIHEDSPGCGSAVAGDPTKLRLVGTTDGPTTPCDESNALCLGNGRFEATVQWRPSTPGGDLGSKRVQPSETPSSGLFASSADGNPQLLLDVLDRCSVNGHYWLSLAAVTDQEFMVSVRDTQTGQTRVYLNPAGSTPASLRDVEAFGACQ
jgi:plastocyanin